MRTRIALAILSLLCGCVYCAGCTKVWSGEQKKVTEIIVDGDACPVLKCPAVLNPAYRSGNTVMIQVTPCYCDYKGKEYEVVTDKMILRITE